MLVLWAYEVLKRVWLSVFVCLFFDVGIYMNLVVLQQSFCHHSCASTIGESLNNQIDRLIQILAISHLSLTTPGW